MRFILICCGFWSLPAFAANCVDLSGKFFVQKDSYYGDSYTIVDVQNGCDSLTETVIYDNYQIGPNTRPLDGKLTHTCDSKGSSCVDAFYRVTGSVLQSMEITSINGVVDNYSEVTASLDSKNNLVLKTRWTDSNGTTTEDDNVAVRQ